MPRGGRTPPGRFAGPHHHSYSALGHRYTQYDPHDASDNMLPDVGDIGICRTIRLAHLHAVVELPRLDFFEEGAQLPTRGSDDHVRIVTLTEKYAVIALRSLDTGSGISREGRLTPAKFHRSPTLKCLWPPAE